MHPTCHLHYEGCTIAATEDDHVIPVSQGGSDELSNRRGACRHCHDVKSRREAVEARRGQYARAKHPREVHPGRAPSPRLSPDT
jgi:5-methylcytosine-specific restriction enzyme A